MRTATLGSKDFFKKPAAPQAPPAKRWFGAGKKPRPLSKEEAFFAILIGAARADGEVAPQEAQEIAALVGRTRTLSTQSPQEIAKWHKDIGLRIETDGLNEMLSAACNSILSQKREESGVARLRSESVFAHAVDLVFADGVVNVHEKDYIEELADALAIDAKRALEIVSVIELKNSF